MSRTRNVTPALLSFLAIVSVAVIHGGAQAQPLSEGFENVAGLTGSGWAFVNNSRVSSGLLWEQGDSVALGFAAHSGTPNSYATTGFDAVDVPSQSDPTSVLSNYLIAPTRTFANGDVINFWTRKVLPPPDFPDRMQVRLSLNGSSTNVGGQVGAGGVGGIGDFTTLLLDINPNQDHNIGSSGYPTDWTQFSITISGLANPTLGRLAFRYFVIDVSVNGDTIGLDDVSITPVPEPGSLALVGFAVIAGWRMRRRRAS
jgi:hypothetical protein